VSDTARADGGAAMTSDSGAATLAIGSADVGAPSDPPWWLRTTERLLDRLPLLEKEMVLVSRLVRPGWTCIDIGAAGGTYVHLLSRLVGTIGHVLAVEPRRASIRMLERMQRHLAWGNVSLFQLALTDREGMERLVVPRMARTEAHLAATGAAAPTGRAGTVETVRAATLDDLLSRLDLRGVDLIKCDVEGAEELVFRGADATLRRWSPIVICEIEQRHLGRYGRSADDVIALFDRYGYRPYRYDAGRLAPIAAVNEADNDYVFMPHRRPVSGRS
jgi:FkbM family methyltransferase